MGVSGPFNCGGMLDCRKNRGAGAAGEVDSEQWTVASEQRRALKFLFAAHCPLFSSAGNSTRRCLIYSVGFPRGAEQ